MILDGKMCSSKLKEALKNEVVAFPSRPKIIDIQIGENAASEIYIRNKGKAANSVGIDFDCVRFGVESTEDEIINKIKELNEDETINGILVQMPIPDKYDYKKIINTIENKTKDIFLLIKLYKRYDKKEKLWNMLINSNYRYLLSDNIEILKDKYNEELYDHFINEFYNILKLGKNRDIYNKASKNIYAISKLNNGDELVKKY